MFVSRWFIVAVTLVGVGAFAAGSLVPGASSARADETAPANKTTPAKPRLSTQELADWIDQRFAQEYEIAGLKVGEPVDDATFLRRSFLDLQGRVPTVAQLRDFLADSGSFKRQDMVDRLLIETKQPDRFAQRSADHLARVWRGMLVPGSR